MNNANSLNKNFNPDTASKKAVPCGVIQDLMILYEDDVCSDESSSLIREHIKDCDNCRKTYEQAAKPLPTITADRDDENTEDSRFINTLKKYRKKITLLNTIIAGFFLLVAAALIKICWTEFLESNIFSVPANDVQITELYQLGGGDIYCTLKFPKLITSPSMEALEINDKTSDKTEGHYKLHFQYPLSVNEEKYIYLNTISFIFPKEVTGGFYSYPDADSDYTCTSIYYQGKNKDDRLVIWEEGQTLEQAPKQIEEKAIRAYQTDGNVSKALDEMNAIGKTLSQDEIIQYFKDYFYSWDAPDCFPIQVDEKLN